MCKKVFFLMKQKREQPLSPRWSTPESGVESHQSPWPTPVHSCLQFYKTNAEVELTPSLSIRLKTSSTCYTNSESWTACPGPGPQDGWCKRKKHAGLSIGILPFFFLLPCKTLIRSPTMHLIKKKVIHITDVKNSIFISSCKRIVAFHIYNRSPG